MTIKNRETKRFSRQPCRFNVILILFSNTETHELITQFLNNILFNIQF